MDTVEQILEFLPYNVKTGCGVAQTVTRRLAVWQARVRILARHPRAEAMKRSRVALDEYYIENIVCMLGKFKNK